MGASCGYRGRVLEISRSVEELASSGFRGLGVGAEWPPEVIQAGLYL